MISLVPICSDSPGLVLAILIKLSCMHGLLAMCFCMIKSYVSLASSVVNIWLALCRLIPFSAAICPCGIPVAACAIIRKSLSILAGLLAGRYLGHVCGFKVVMLQYPVCLGDWVIFGAPGGCQIDYLALSSAWIWAGAGGLPSLVVVPVF